MYHSNCLTSRRTKVMKWYWWAILVALILVVIIGGAYLRWGFWSGIL
jgi:hypothetical protein